MPTPEAQKIWDELNPPSTLIRGGTPDERERLRQPLQRKTHWQVSASVAAQKYRAGELYVIEEFTCADCPQVSECSDSFGLFNTDGDCSRKI